MEAVETVDVSWLHHSHKGKNGSLAVFTFEYLPRILIYLLDHLSRCRSASSAVSDKSAADSDATAAQQSTTLDATSTSSPNGIASTPGPLTSPTAENSVDPSHKDTATPDSEGKAADKSAGAQKTAPKQSSPRPISGRRNSWISNLSSKFSSGSTPPSLSTFKPNSSSPKNASPISKLDTHNPFGAAYSPWEKDDEHKEDPAPLASTSPKGPSFFQNAFRKLSSSGSSGPGKLVPNGGLCQRRVMNVDQQRDRCKIAELDQAKLRRVAFCVDVEIAGVSRREAADSVAQASNGQLQPQPQPQPQPQLSDTTTQKNKKADSKSKGKKDANGGAANGMANPQVVTESEAKPTTEVKEPTKEPTRKQEKKKRSEEERRERKERKRRLAEVNGTIPLQLRVDDDEDDEPSSSGPTPSTTRSKSQSHPTTDPVRIYRRCCQLRETPVLKGVVDQISAPSSTLAEAPGTVAVLDLSNFPMNSQDIATFGDWLAIVPVRKLILENCALTDESVRVILAGLLSTKTVEQMRLRRKRLKKSKGTTAAPEKESFGVVEKLSFKDNPKIGPEGWRHISLFVHLSKSLKAIDLSGIPLPRAQVLHNGGLGSMARPQKPAVDVPTVFANSLAERFGGDHLEELLLSECNPTTDDVQKICDAAIAVGLRRLGFANNNLDRQGLEHVVRYLAAGKCEGLDLGGNQLSDHLDLLIAAIDASQPLYALSLADCSLTPSVMAPLLQSFTQLPDFRFVDFSHNPDLFSSQPDALATFRRFLPKMLSLKRIHLADVNLSPDHAIALAEILPECPSLCHLNVLENPAIVKTASTADPKTQEEACAVYASLMAAVRVSRSIIAVDIEVPSAESNEVVKALASQIVAYSLRNLEQNAMGEEVVSLVGPAAPAARPHVPVPEILQHIVGHNDYEDAGDDDDEPAPDEDYVLGGTGVVKALGVCLGALDHHRSESYGDHSAPPSGTSTPRHRKAKPITSKKPLDMSKNLLASARTIRTRIQSALVREDRAGNDLNYRRLQFLDFTLSRMIQRFEDEYPETRIIAPPTPLIPNDVSSQNSDECPTAMSGGDLGLNGNPADGDTAIDDEDTDHYLIRLSRSSSMTSLHSRAMTSEEGHVHRLGQNLRRDFLKSSMDPQDEDDDGFSSPSFAKPSYDALQEKLERLQDEQARTLSEGAGVGKAMEKVGSTVEDLWMTQKQDAEAFAKFKESQIAAQINSGMRKPNLGNDDVGPKDETHLNEPK
ncbi:hypothetical protein ASPZODRAFT_139250 [Penicilliopsis zonata CBS 506.65]|uniref:Cell wall biogenesis protein Mhp1 n=1 Tax=Penicilliopsis zonata CBS 506.65 TaxID=1073090 RepID=A0A1L9SRZ8_9EURO|nr:hypothetical protein ASPZODRAFT_139250 [Penicilliopsis zonata CBS 506.65]OJJ49904.1 hypothetical protein ASPZODRAFT_139250 [Penicilliopsis zonata CBS 506.65]